MDNPFQRIKELSDEIEQMKASERDAHEALTAHDIPEEGNGGAKLTIADRIYLLGAELERARLAGA
jgi:hypothetical protein